MRPLTFTVYPTAKTNEGFPVTLPWPEWCQRFATHAVRESGPTKPELDYAKDGEAIVLGFIPEGARRSKAAVTEVHALGLDLDSLSDEEIEVVLDKLAPYAHALFTTHKSGAAVVGGLTRLRVILPLDKPIPASQHPQAWAWLNAFTGGKTDQSTKDASRLFYMPSTWDKTRASCFSGVHDGTWIAPQTHDVAPGEVLEGGSISVDVPGQLRFATVNLKRIRGDQLSADGTELKPISDALLAGEPYAEPGHRHKANLAITMFLAKRCPVRLYPDALATLFGPSLAKMAAANPSMDTEITTVISCYEGARLKHIAAADGKLAKAHDNARQLQQRMSTKQSGPYTSADLARIATRQQCAVEDLDRRWILQKGNTFFFLTHSGTYSPPYNNYEARVAAVEHLLRSPVQLFKWSSVNPMARVPIHELVEDYGRVVRDIVVETSRSYSLYVPEDDTLLHASCPPLVTRAHFHEDVDHWMQIAAGVLYTRLKDWMACALDLTKCVCALYLAGPPGAGKNVFVQGLARYWYKDGPSDFDRITQNFNEQLMRCPVVLADEELPKFRSTSANAALRKMIGIYTRELSRKYMPPASIRGYSRVVLSANHERLLRGESVLSKDDQTAIAQRILFIWIPQEASDFHDSLPQARRDEWLNGAIAEHALWLAENHKVEKSGRFWVNGDASQMVRGIVAGSEWNSLVVEACVRYLMDPDRFQSCKKYWQHGGGRLLVNVQGIIDSWQTLFPASRKEPETTQLCAALRAISHKDRIQLRRGGGRVKYYNIDLEHLWVMADQQGIGDRDELASLVNSPVAVDRNEITIAETLSTELTAATKTKG